MLLFLYAKNSLARANLAALSLSLACAASALIMIAFFHKLGGRAQTPQGHIKQVFQMSAPITVMRVSSALVNFLIAIIIPKRLIVSGLSNSKAMEIYGSSVGMSMGFVRAYNSDRALAVALVPRVKRNEENLTCLSNTAKNAVGFYNYRFCFILCFIMGDEIGMFVFNNQLSGRFWRSLCDYNLFDRGTYHFYDEFYGVATAGFINYYIGVALLFVCWF